MYHAFSAIFDIVAGITAHPLCQLFDEHMTNMLKEFEDVHQGAVTDEVLHDLAHNFSFPVPCLPGDMSLIEDLLADMDMQLHKEPKLALNIRLRLRLLHVGPVLFRLVVVRNYLDRPPENDKVIFQLVKQHRIFRLWTSHELALAACNGEENTSPDSPLDQAPTPELYKLAVIDDGDLTLSDGRPLVAIRNLQSVNWSSGPALSGGRRKPRRYTPPHLRVIPAGPRPKPRPAYKKAVRFEDTLEENSEGVTRLRRSKRAQMAVQA
jgi:hypothetical protein